MHLYREINFQDDQHTFLGSRTLGPSLFNMIEFNALCFWFSFSQLIEVTGKTQDECMVALHDCNEDVNRAINFLLESTSDTVSQYTHTTHIYMHIV